MKKDWGTQGSAFNTSVKATLVNLQLPKFSTRRHFEAEMHL